MRVLEFVSVEEAHLGELSGWTARIEKILGDAAEEATVAEMGGPLGDVVATAYVERIGQALVSESDRPGFGYKFDVLGNKTPNAFALPNGSIYVTVGLLRLLRSEAELANVLGHEVSHVTQHHSMKQLKVNLGATGLAAALSRLLKPVLGREDRQSAKELISGLITSGYSRENENEADEVGQKLAAKCGWSPRGMVDVMRLFLSMEKERPEGIKAYMQSHPFAGDRLELAEKRVRLLPEGEEGRERYQEFLRHLGEEAPAPKPAEEAPPFVPAPQAALTDEVREFPFFPVIFASGALLLFIVTLLLDSKR